MNSTPAILESVAVMASSAIVVGIIAYIVVMTWWRGWPVSPSLQLGEMLLRQGERVARTAIAPGGNDFALVVRRCVGCKEAARCRAWLDSGQREGYDAFCPNAGFVDRMKQIAA